MDKNLRILFISHDSTITGAPILLLNLLKLLKQDSSIDFELLLYRGGALEEDFKTLTTVSVLKNKFYGTEKNPAKRVSNYLKYRLNLRRWKKTLSNFDLVFSNTVTNGRLLQLLRVKEVPVISFVHELESVIQLYQQDAKLTFDCSKRIAYPSNPVRENLLTKHGIVEGKLDRLDYYFPIDPNAIVQLNKEKERAIWCARYDLSPDKFFVVSMGTATYRKGIDLFVKVAEALKEEKDICFVWIGDFIDAATRHKIRVKINEYELNETLIITGFQAPSLNTLLPFDLFLLTSREDPYPLVTIEAALCRVPVLAFKSGGIEDFVENHCGWLVNNFSPNEMAEKIVQLKTNTQEIKLVGENAWSKGMELHANKQRTLNQLKTLFEKAVYD